MADLATQLTVERVVLHGIDIPQDDLNRFPDLLTAELSRLLENGLPTPGTDPGKGAEESTPLVLSSPPDVVILARDLAERILVAASVDDAFDG
jgi:hypothetical protein